MNLNKEKKEEPSMKNILEHTLKWTPNFVVGEIKGRSNNWLKMHNKPMRRQGVSDENIKEQIHRVTKFMNTGSQSPFAINAKKFESPLEEEEREFIQRRFLKENNI